MFTSKFNIFLKTKITNVDSFESIMEIEAFFTRSTYFVFLDVLRNHVSKCVSILCLNTANCLTILIRG